MLRAAAAEPNPVVIIEARALYQTKGEVDFGESCESLGESRLVRAGTAATVVSYGTALATCERAVETLAEEGLDLQLVDLRWLNPIDWPGLNRQVADTGGRALVVHEANLTGGFGAEIAARLWEGGAKQVRRLGAKDSRMPAAPSLQAAVLPSVEEVVADIRTLVTRRD